MPCRRVHTRNRVMGRRTVALLAGACAWLTAADAAWGQAECPVPKPKYEGGSPRFHRASVDIGGIPYRYTVLLPADYERSGRRYPVLYLYHGAGGFEESWMATGEQPPLIETISAQTPVIIVMPDAGVIGSHSDWPDDPAQQWETFHVKRLVPHVDATYRTRPGREHRAMFGFSMGGFGAMHHAFRHPDVFGAAGTASGFPDASFRMVAPFMPFVAALGATCTGSQMPFGPWGDPVTESETWEEHNPAAHVDRLRNTFLYAATANGVPCDQEDVETLAQHVVPDYTYASESVMRESTRSFHQALDAAGIEHVYREWECGIHSDRYGDMALTEWWPLMTAFFDRAAQAPRATPPRRTAPALRLYVRPLRPQRGRKVRFRLRVTALMDGRRLPVSGARVTLAGRRAVTDARGRATLTARVRAGRHAASARKPGFRPARRVVTTRA